MMYYPYMPYYQSTPIPSYVRVFHASPDAPGVDVYANGALIAKNLKYKEFTNYLSIIPGRYTILVFPTGKKDTPVINTVIDVMPNQNYTIAATGTLRDLQPLVIPDTASPMLPGKTQIKFVHLSPNAPKVDLTLGDGTILFRNVDFRDITNNLSISPGNHTLQLRLAGTNKIVLTAPNQNLRPNRYYTVYAVGLGNKKAPLQIITALDKSSY
ncbi:DUF4397 domain-containing protein [Anaerophilus nitritogenes]|uniref:DUF4397 domain-containing protein n=1 Tax=Anaerophilus nitritogenes TaxID=2498136 RepID=UPI00101C2557|nr:DUF4397 domain-containing protein [Anaerophilus nitritogenes]